MISLDEQVDVKNQVKSILVDVLPIDFNIIVGIRSNFFGGNYLKIMFSPIDKTINNVDDQYPQVVSLCLDFDDLVLSVQSYGCCGGNRIFISPDLNNVSEKYLAMVGVKVPFRKPKSELSSIYKAIEKFGINYLKVLGENRARLMYSNMVDYSFLDK